MDGGPTLVVMAAGLGRRFGAAKQVERVGPDGERLLEYSVFDAIRSGFTRVVFVVRQEIATAFDSLARTIPVETSIVFQGTAQGPRGTTEAVLAAGDAVAGPFAAINADDFYGRAAFDLARSACAEAAASGLSAVLAMRLDATLSPHGGVTRAILSLQGDRVAGIEETRGVANVEGRIADPFGRHFTGSELVSMNFWMFPASALAALRRAFDRFAASRHEHPRAELPLPDAIADLLGKQDVQVRAIPSAGPWFGLTHAGDREAVAARLRALHEGGAYPSPLFERRNR